MEYEIYDINFNKATSEVAIDRHRVLCTEWTTCVLVGDKVNVASYVFSGRTVRQARGNKGGNSTGACFTAP